jgi:signal peptidase I
LPSVVLFAAAAFILLLARIFVVDVVRVEGRSMVPTLAPGQVVMVNKLAYGIRRPFRYGYWLKWSSPRKGDVVSLRHPITGDLLIKRSLSSGGESIELDRSLVTTGGNTFVVSGPALRFFQRIDRLPMNSVLVLGDNPGYSNDSRHFGPVSANLISGRVVGRGHE